MIISIKEDGVAYESACNSDSFPGTIVHSTPRGACVDMLATARKTPNAGDGNNTAEYKGSDKYE